MSVQVIGKILDGSPHTHGVRLVLIALANYSDPKGCAYPSIPTIARCAGLCERNVQKVIKFLVKKGHLNIHEGKGPNGVRLYEILPGAWGENGGVNSCASDSLGVNSHAQKVDVNSPGGVNSCASPYIEPSVQPSFNLCGKEPREEKSCKKKQFPKSSPDKQPSEHNLFIRIWSEKYKETFGEKYFFSGGADAKAVKAILSFGSAQDAIDVAVKSWGYYKHGEFGYEQSITIKGFSSKFGTYSLQAARGIPKRQSNFTNGQSNRKEITDEQHAKGW